VKVRNSVVFVTGGNRGLGLAFAREALARGAAKVYAGIRDPRRFNVPDIIPVKLDVTDPSSVRAAAAVAGDTSLLVNNAGIGRVGSALEDNLDQLSREVFETNYFGLIRTTQAFAPILSRNGGGAIINVLSDVTWRPRVMLTGYSASKAAAWSFTNNVRLQLQEQGTQVVGLHVGFVDTDLVKALDVPKADPVDVVRKTFEALEAGNYEALADEGTRALQAGLSAFPASYTRPG
jgi:NAD(P)-dependent dehydrogenase (short-subunit alcohol dehydrogenase family)